MSDYASATEDGFTVTSNTETAEQITETLKPEPQPEPEPDKPVDKTLSKAASTLGKKGGEAAAAKRAEAAKEAQAQTEEGTEGADSPAVDADKSAGAESDSDDDASDIKKPAIRKRIEAKAKEAQEYRARWESERNERERLAAEVERLRSGKPSEEPKKPAPSADSEPQEADYDDYKEFVKATARYEYRQAQIEAQKAEQATARDRRISSALDTFFKRVDEHGKKSPDFLESTRSIAAMLQPSFTLENGRAAGPLNVMADEILISEHAPALMLHFAAHPEDLQRFAALGSPRDVQREMAKLEVKLDGATAGTRVVAEVSQSQAKPPVRPVTGSPHTADVAPDPDSSSFDEHLRFYNAKERRAR